MKIIHKKAHSAGFSLVEIVMALSIAAVALVSMMALLGSLFPMSGSSKDRFASVRIFQTLSHEVQMMTWDEILKAESSSGIRYFSEQGDEVAKGEFEAIYAATAKFEQLGDWPNLDASESGLYLRNSDANRRVTISVYNKGSTDEPFSDPKAVRELTIMVTRFDK